MTTCSLCGGACTGADLRALLDPCLTWLWRRVADRADALGDPDQSSGRMKINAPDTAAERYSARGLIGEAPLHPGQSRSVNLASLCTRLQIHGATLTPGAVAAHAVGRPLGTAVKERRAAKALARRRAQYGQELLADLPPTAPYRPDPNTCWQTLRSTNWEARVTKALEPEALLERAAAVLAALPTDHRVDRRVLAHTITGNPHALDRGTDLGGLVLAMLAGNIPRESRKGLRTAWAHLNVDCDTFTGGLISINMYPRGWRVPRPPLILTSSHLAKCTWRPPSERSPWIFITENPSVAAAALATGSPHRLVCTNGTPSTTALLALTRMCTAGWKLAVRADFDAAGLRHVNTLLQALPGAVPWRMNSTDYQDSVHPDPFQLDLLDVEALPETPWDPTLRQDMSVIGQPAYEEALIAVLCADLILGRPSSSRRAADHSEIHVGQREALDAVGAT
ncbi:DUF2399 domain-containing protein [Streptomyces abikoensis]|uniref:DUF2399 domain-containing protein n=1 Tax=Streptomyces abikoensis TaxID=97398 RepID=A0ABW7TCR1_9ACTN